MNNKYINNREKYRKRYYRVRLGVLQMIHYPLLNLLLFIPVFGLVAFIYFKMQILNAEISAFFYPIIKFILDVLTYAVPITLLLAVISIVSVATAIRDEANVQMAFTKDELRNGSPILINKKRIKGTDVIQREFYSNIPLRIWIKRIDELSDSLNVHFVEEIRYGGKSNGKRVIICTAPSRDLPNRNTLYDEEF